MKTILLVDSRPAILNLLRSILAPHHHILAATHKEEAETILRTGRERPDLILLDVDVPGINGLRFAHQVQEQWGIPVVFLRCADEPTEGPAAITSYAADLITRPFDFQELLVRVEAILSPSQPRDDLKTTVRQIQIMKLMANGLNDAEIAERLTITERTVKWHIHQAMHELEANSRPHLISIAIQTGLILQDHK